MSRKNKVIIISVIVIGVLIIIGIYQKEQRKQVLVEQMKEYLKGKYNEEFEYLSSYSHIGGAGSLQRVHGARFRPIGEADLEFFCSDLGSLGISDSFLIVLGHQAMQPFAEQVCQEVFKKKEKYLVYAQAVPDLHKEYRGRPTFQSLIDNQVIEDVSFRLIVCLYGEYEKEEVRGKVYEIAQIMKKTGIQQGGSVAIKVYNAKAEFLADSGMFNETDREGMQFKCELGGKYDSDFTLEDISIQDKVTLYNLNEE